MSRLTQFLGLTSENNDRVAEGADKLKTATEFLGDVADHFEQPVAGSLADIIEAALPWAAGVADIVGDAVPPVKAVLKIVGLLTRETDPRLLGLVAFSLAYQSAVAEVVKQIERDGDLSKQINGHLRAHNMKNVTRPQSRRESPEDFDGFRFDTALSHPLVRYADQALHELAGAANYSPNLQRELRQRVHRRLVDTFRAIISDGRVKEKFDPLARFLSMENRGYATQAAIDRHIGYQSWRFNNAPALGREGTMSILCSLRSIFIPLDCGLMSWGDIRELSRAKVGPEQERSPFDESCGGRTAMLSEVVKLLGVASFDDVIVIQGVAGSGKSAFTLQLCAALSELSLRPIRIRMRDLSLDPQVSLIEDMTGALLQGSGDDAFDAQFGPRPSARDIDLSHLLDETVPFGETNIAPYVLIFDGWDEISISASEGFRIRIEKTLAAIRQLLLGRTHRVRVVLTGRPSEDVNQAKFLKEGTPVLTVRPLTKPQLGLFSNTLFSYHQSISNVAGPQLDLRQRIISLLGQYDEDVGGPDSKKQSILGLPLIALMAIWLVLNDNSPPEDLLTNRTSLYRRLVDLTCPHGGNVISIGPERARILGDELRNLLRRTAAAMTMRGTEQISNDELMLRLEADGLAEVGSLAVTDDETTKLRLSFFFIPGLKEHGGEFIHKSFREYLFAEAVVEAVKRLAHADQRLPARVPYWKDFDDTDPRRDAIEQLGRLLGPQWLTLDVSRHIRWLIGWELRRSRTPAGDWQKRDETRPISIADWTATRDVLADLWDWWAEGVHLRPQPRRERGERSFTFKEPYAVRLSEEIVPRDLPRNALPEPVRVTTLDAHFGDALFRLNCATHFEVNRATGWLDRSHEGVGSLPRSLWEGRSWGPDDRKYQIKVVQDDIYWVAFSPSGWNVMDGYFSAYCSRINAAGWRPGGSFPNGVDMTGVDFRGVGLVIHHISNVSLRYACLSQAYFVGSYMIACDFRDCAADGAVFESATLIGANFEGADLREAMFDEARVHASSFAGADVVDLVTGRSVWVNTEKSSLVGAKTRGARFMKL